MIPMATSCRTTKERGQRWISGIVLFGRSVCSDSYRKIIKNNSYLSSGISISHTESISELMHYSIVGECIIMMT